MSENVCFWPLYLTISLNGRSASGLPSFPFEASVLVPLWPWMLPWRPESSLTLPLLHGHLLFKPGFLRNCYFFTEVKLLDQDTSWCWKFWIHFFLFFSWNTMYCGFSPSCISDSAILYHPVLFSFNTFSIPFFDFSMWGTLITLGLDSLSTDFFVFFIYVLCNHPDFPSLPIICFFISVMFLLIFIVIYF